MDLKRLGNLMGEAPRDDASARPADGRRTRTLVRAASILVISVAVVFYAGARVGGPLRARPVPFRPPAVAPEIPRVGSLPLPAGSVAGRSVVLVTLDTTRLDRLGCYGRAEAETPHLDRLARTGAIFSRAYATSSATLPAHASLLTGLYPHRHGAAANGMFALTDARKTLAEVLDRHGYETAAFVSAFPVDARFGLAQGFDLYDDDTDRHAGSEQMGERSAQHTTDRAVAWLRDRPAGPFFLWVHYFDPHASYRPPEPFASRHSHPYDGEIAFVDHQLGRLLKALSRTTEHDALVAVTADHGEALGEHGEQTHGYLVQEATLRVPLLLRAPGIVPEGVHVDARVSQVDLLPTLLAGLGIPAPVDLDGRDLARAPDPDRAILAETLMGRVSFGWSRLSALYHGSLKLVDGEYAALYDLERDPREVRDVSTPRRRDVAALRERLLAVRGGEGRRLHPSPVGLGDAARGRLAALGYAVPADGKPTAIDAAGAGPDPRRHIGLYTQLQHTMAAPYYADQTSWLTRFLAWRRGLELPQTRQGVIEALEDLAARRPGFAPVHFHLEQLYHEAGRTEDAARARAQLAKLRRSRPLAPERDEG